jgi:hypothetical protein
VILKEDWVMKSFNASAVLAATIILFAVCPVAGQERKCKTVDARMQLHGTKEGCTSPIGLCTVAKVNGGFLDGATWYFTALATAPSAGISGAVEPASTLSYAGRVTVTNDKGTFTTTNVGVFDTALGAFSQLDRIQNGTAGFEDATGSLFVAATGAPAAGFEAAVRGEVCSARD